MTDIAMTDDDALDVISETITSRATLECWFEGKTLTVLVPNESGVLKFVKLRLVGIRDQASAADLRGEPA